MRGGKLERNSRGKQIKAAAQALLQNFLTWQQHPDGRMPEKARPYTLQAVNMGTCACKNWLRKAVAIDLSADTSHWQWQMQRGTQGILIEESMGTAAELLVYRDLLLLLKW